MMMKIELILDLDFMKIQSYENLDETHSVIERREVFVVYS